MDCSVEYVRVVVTTPPTITSRVGGLRSMSVIMVGIGVWVSISTKCQVP